MQRMKGRSHRRRTGASLLVALALFALAQALVSAQLPKDPRPPDTAPLRTLNYPSTDNVRTNGSSSGAPAYGQPLEMVPPGRASVTVPILMYHYIRTNPDPRDALGGSLSVSPADFRAQMD